VSEIQSEYFYRYVLCAGAAAVARMRSGADDAGAVGWPVDIRGGLL